MRTVGLSAWAAVGAALLLGRPASAEYALLTAPEQARLLELVRTDAAARAEFAAMVRGAEAALGRPPNPIRLIQTEGKLAGDPVKVATQHALADMGDLTDLSYAYLLTGEGRYAEQARLIILAWSRVNRPTGDPIDETNLEPLIVAYDFTRASYLAADRAEADAYLQRLIKAEWGARQLTTNWQSHRLKVIGLSAYVLGDGTQIARAVDGFKRLVDANLNADGTSYDFLERDALHYHVYDLEPLLTLAIAAHRHGLDFYDYVGAKGGSLRRSVQFLIPFCTGASQHREFVNSKVLFDRQRAANGEKGYQIGHLFRPAEGYRALSLAAVLDDAARPVLVPLASRSSDAMVQWNLVLGDAAQSR